MTDPRAQLYLQASENLQTATGILQKHDLDLDPREAWWMNVAVAGVLATMACTPIEVLYEVNAIEQARSARTMDLAEGIVNNIVDKINGDDT